MDKEMIDNKRREIVFHFNKAHLVDNNIPMWVIKHKGNTYYVNHVDVAEGVGFSTKETPNNPHTKGSIKFKGKLSIKFVDTEIIAYIC
jgi:hypothetical protein